MAGSKTSSSLKGALDSIRPRGFEFLLEEQIDGFLGLTGGASFCGSERERQNPAWALFAIA